MIRITNGAYLEERKVQMTLYCQEEEELGKLKTRSHEKVVVSINDRIPFYEPIRSKGIKRNKGDTTPF